MKLSIITINYNNAAGLESTIKSVLGQTCRDFEYIVVDGNSTDGSKEVLKRYSDQIEVPISEPDTGIYNAMNKGAYHASGEYMLFLNSGDELYDNNVIERIYQQTLDSEIISGKLYVYSESSSCLNTPPSVISLYTFTGGSLPHPSTLIKKSTFDEVGGYCEDYRIISDWCFFVDALLVKGCSYRTMDVLVSKFNQYGISTTAGEKEEPKKWEYLQVLFPAAIPDYLGLQDEALCNVVYFIASKKGLSKKLWSFPFKVVNRIFKLRSVLRKRLIVSDMKR